MWKDGFEKGIERLRDPQIRARLKREVAQGSQPDWTNFVFNAGAWGHVVLSNSAGERYRAYEGQDFATIGKTLGRDPADVAWDIIVEAKRGSWPSALYFMMSDADIKLALRAPWTSIGTDAGASLAIGQPDGMGIRHPRVNGTFPRVLAHYVRDEGALTIEDAVRKMSSWPAERMGLHDRGLIREGMRADVVIFDLDRVKDDATYEKPLLPSTGIDHVIVNGVPTILDGRYTGALAGMVLKNQCAR